MKTRYFQLVIAAILLCGAAVFTACTKEDNPGSGVDSSCIAMIVKNGQIDYWRQCPRQRTTKKGLFHELTIDILLQTLSASEVQMTVQEHCFCLLEN